MEIVEKKKELVPKLRFKEFQDNWQLKKLGDIGKVKMCKRIFNNQTSEDAEIPFYKIGTFGKDPDAFISRELFEDFKSKYSYPKKGEILISASGTLGRTVVYDGSDSYYQDSNIVWIENDEKLLTNELLYFVLQIVRYESEGGTIQRLYNSIISAAKFSCPTLPEQQKIAAFLSAVDEKIQQLRQKKALLEKYKKGVMQKLFPKKAGQAPELRFKKPDGSNYPDWEEKKLGEIATFKKGKGISKGDISEDGVFECIRYGELYTQYNEIIEETFSRTSVDESGLIFSDTNDVIIPASGETQIDIATASCVMRSGIALGGDLNIIKSPLNGVFLSYYLNSSKKFDIAKMAQGNSVVHLYSSQLQTLNINFPSKEEQQKIADFLTGIDQKINQVEIQINQNQTFKKGLSQQMFV